MYILKQLFFLFSVNSGRMFTSISMNDYNWRELKLSRDF